MVDFGWLLRGAKSGGENSKIMGEHLRTWPDIFEHFMTFAGQGL